MTLLTLIVHARKRLREQTGAVALMTLAYMIGCGLVCLFTLWGIANATGAYNALYGATQTAAYAAVSKTDRTPSGDTVRFLCTNWAPTTGECRAGETLDAAVNAAQTALAPGTPGNFGLAYGVNTQFTDRNGNPSGPMVYAFSPATNPGEAESYYNSTGSCTRHNPSTNNVDLICWYINDVVGSPRNFEPGVVVYMRADVPMCPMRRCPTVTLGTAAAATMSQPER